MASPVTQEEHERIVSILKDGATCGEAARRVGRSKDTIRRIASRESIDFVRAATKKATQARIRYDQAERREVLNEGFDKAREILAGLNSSRDLRSWSVAVGTLVDKVRLEEGEATERGEHTHANRPTLEDELARLEAEMEAPGGLEGGSQ